MMSTREFLELLRRRIAVILLLSILAAAAVLLITSIVVKPVYESTAKMIVNAGADQTTSLTITNDQITSSQKLVDTYAVIVRSRNLLGQVIERLDLDYSYESFSRMVNVSPVNGTQIMQISVRSTDPESARKIADEIVKLAPKELEKILHAGSVETVDDPYVSSKPVSPNKNLDAMLAFLLTAIVSTFVFTLAYINDGTFRTEEEVTEELNMPVLACIPSGNRKRRRA